MQSILRFPFLSCTVGRGWFPAPPPRFLALPLPAAPRPEKKIASPSIPDLNMPLFCLFPPKILQKFQKFSENSENSPKILKMRQKFAENSLKRRSLEAEISYREIKPNIVPISYQIEKKRIAQGCPWALIGKYFNNTGTVHYTPQCTMHCTLHYIMHCILYCSIKV